MYLLILHQPNDYLFHYIYTDILIPQTENPLNLMWLLHFDLSNFLHYYLLLLALLVPLYLLYLLLLPFLKHFPNGLLPTHSMFHLSLNFLLLLLMSFYLLFLMYQFLSKALFLEKLLYHLVLVYHHTIPYIHL